MTRVPSLISSRVSRSLRSTSSRRRPVHGNGALVGDDVEEGRVLAAEPPRVGPSNR